MLDAQKSSRIFNITAKNVVLKNLKFINGNADEGGAIYSQATNLVIDSCTFENNVAKFYGGAILNLGDKFTVTSSSFKNNKLTNDKNSWSGGGGAINCNAATVKNSEFISNTAQTNGGAICYNDGGEPNKKVLKIDSCTFKKNSKGAVYSDAYKTKVYNSLFDSNSGSNGGAIVVTRNLLCEKTTFNKNSAKSNPAFSIIFNSIDFEEEESIYSCTLKNCIINPTTTEQQFNLESANKLTIKSLTIGKYKYSVKDYNHRYISVKVLNKNNKPVKSAKIKFLVKFEKKSSKTVKTNSKGIAKIDLKSVNKKISVGQVVYYSFSFANSKKYMATDRLRLGKIPGVVKASNVTKKYKSSKKYKIKVKNSVTKKPLSKIKVKLKVYTGKKYKTYKVKTNKKGIAYFSVNKLSKGKHKMTIKSGNKNYKFSKIVSIKIKK